MARINLATFSVAPLPGHRCRLDQLGNIYRLERLLFCVQLTAKHLQPSRLQSPRFFRQPTFLCVKLPVFAGGSWLVAASSPAVFSMRDFQPISRRNIGLLVENSIPCNCILVKVRRALHECLRPEMFNEYSNDGINRFKNDF